jgi:gamma-glutamyltranspeptidase/glutathione hydrolase
MSRTSIAAVVSLLVITATVPTGAARQPVRARHGMAVAMESQAVDVGVSVMQKGGNAIDAAVAMGFAMAATHPFAGNLGGGGFMLIRFADGRSTFIDFREMAPAKASRNMYLDAKGELTKDSIEGWRSSGVPGTVRGFQMAVEKYGKKSWADNMAPAIQLAKGFPVSYALAESMKGSRALGADPESKHQRSPADDSTVDAGRRKGRRRLRSVSRRSHVSLRSGWDSPGLGCTEHAA